MLSKVFEVHLYFEQRNVFASAACVYIIGYIIIVDIYTHRCQDYVSIFWYGGIFFE